MHSRTLAHTCRSFHPALSTTAIVASPELELEFLVSERASVKKATLQRYVRSLSIGVQVDFCVGNHHVLIDALEVAYLQCLSASKRAEFRSLASLCAFQAAQWRAGGSTSAARCQMTRS